MRALVTVALILVLAAPAGASEVAGGGSPEQPNAQGDCVSDALTGDRDLCAMWVTGVYSGDHLVGATFGLRTADPVVLTPTSRYAFRWVDERRAADAEDPQGCVYEIGVGLDELAQPEARFLSKKRDFNAEDGACGWRGVLYQVLGLFGPDLDASRSGLRVEVDGDTLLVHARRQAFSDLRRAIDAGVFYELEAITRSDTVKPLLVDRLGAGTVDLR